MHRPEYLLFTDADVIFQPQAVRRALAQAVATQADHFVLLPTLILRTAGEAALVGFLQVMGLWSARPWRVADAKAKRDAMGIGAFNMLRTSAYLSLGGFEALRMQIVEDVTLAPAGEGAWDAAAHRVWSGDAHPSLGRRERWAL